MLYWNGFNVAGEGYLETDWTETSVVLKYCNPFFTNFTDCIEPKQMLYWNLARDIASAVLCSYWTKTNITLKLLVASSSICAIILCGSFL